jgi:hypothetical protein
VGRVVVDRAGKYHDHQNSERGERWWDGHPNKGEVGKGAVPSHVGVAALSPPSSGHSPGRDDVIVARDDVGSRGGMCRPHPDLVQGPCALVSLCRPCA